MNSKRVLLSVGIVSGILCVVAIVVYYFHNNHKHLITDTPIKATYEQRVTDQEIVHKTDPVTKVLDTHTASTKDNKKMQLLWQQDFSKVSKGTPDPRFWNIATEATHVYNGEMQRYSPNSENVRIENGRLILEAHRTNDGYTSGRIDTKGRVYIESNSRLEANIKLPRGKGTWPAFWLLSSNQPVTSRMNPSDADWQKDRFYMWDGEIDIMEAYGVFPGMVEATVHTFDLSQEKQYKIPGNPHDFHTYWLEWDSERLTIGIDEFAYNTYGKSSSLSRWPFTEDNKFYIILNLAMGGTGGGQIVSSKDDVWRLEVESIKYYRL